MCANNADIQVLRDLAGQYAEIAAKPVQEERRRLWHAHNSLEKTRIPVVIRAFAWIEISKQFPMLCTDPLFRGIENQLRMAIYRDTIGDDFILEPWISVGAAVKFASGNHYHWGVWAKAISSGAESGAKTYIPPLKKTEDMDLLVSPHHIIDEAQTKARVEKVRDAIGDIIPVNLDRGPAYRMWRADISSDIAMLRGLEQIMWDMYDRPEWLHGLLAFMRDGILNVHGEAEKAGDWQLANHENQSMSYARELKDPAANSGPVPRKALWYFMASQEYQLISPEMFDEFLLAYQLPILSHFGLTAYGCCEDLTRKIPYLKKIPNLRRIAVTPWADKRSCSEQIGSRYVLSWRPSPAEAVSFGLDREAVEKTVKEAMAIFEPAGNIWDITLKDVETVQGDPNRVREWTRIVRSVLES